MKRYSSDTANEEKKTSKNFWELKHDDLNIKKDNSCELKVFSKEFRVLQLSVG